MKDSQNGYRSEEIEVKKLAVSNSNVRRREITAGIKELAASMDQYGLQQPIVVQEVADDRYEIIIGQRRYWAAVELQWERIPARVRTQPLDPFQAKIVSFSENVRRRDLAPRDKADVCRMMLDELGSVTLVAQRLGIGEPTVRKWLGYYAVPEGLKRLVEQEKISVPMATRLAQYVPEESSAYSREGLEWIDRADLKGVLLRHCPNLAMTGLANVKNAFEPWDTDEILDPARHPLRAFDPDLGADPWRGDAMKSRWKGREV